MIVSRMWLNRVATVAGGWNLVIQTRKDNDKRQQWVYNGRSKTIETMHDRTKSMDYRGGNIYAYATDARHYQLIRYENALLINKQNNDVEYVMAIQSKLDTENRQIVREAQND